ncbi:MAG: hypothetical protein K9W43_05885 [Candidatus Thorarchaeota archaeon]|nr:hypothetical protein [Candidatus Thorarchaeota archaeon]
MKYSHIAIIGAFAILMLLPLSGNSTVQPLPVSSQITDNNLLLNGGAAQVAGYGQDEAKWWNSSYVYRQYLNITEPGISDRTLVPIHLYLTFEDGHCYRDSIRVMYYNDPTWSALPFQIWNTTYDASGNYILSTRVSFSVNVTQGATEQNYYIYYAKNDVGSVFYPDYYPFVYKTYTLSVLNLVSYYDDNNYTVQMWDDANQVWDDPRNVDSRWASSTGVIQSGTVTNVPYGQLDKYEVIRIEPNTDTYDYSAFLGFYAVHSYYPLAVTAGSGHKNSNPAVNDWYPGVDELGTGVGTKFIIGGVSGFDSDYEGKYWIQAMSDNTQVWVWTSSEVLDTPSDWMFYNKTTVSSWPVTLKAGEYISKKNVNYQTVFMVNSTKPIATRAGDVDAAYSRDIMGMYPSITGALAGSEFYTIDMGHSYDRTRITNVGSTSVSVTIYRNSGSGWSTVTTQTISANGYYDVGQGTASDTDPEDVLHIVSSTGAKLTVQGIYKPTSGSDWGDWVSTTSGYRFGTDFKLWGFSGMKFFIYAMENAQVNVTGSNSGTVNIPAGGVDIFLPLSSSPSLYTISSNVTISVVRAAKFSTSSPYAPSGDQGYGWMVPAYMPERDEYGVSVSKSSERHLFEFDITVVDLDGLPVSGATVTLYNSSTSAVWIDDQGKNRTGITDSNGLIIFEGLNNGTYEVHTVIDAATWLVTSYTNVWITDTSNHTITGSITPVTITLKMASIDIHLNDLNGDSMNDNVDEDIYMRICNGSDYQSYIHQAKANATGWLHFPRLPQDDYSLFAKYAGANSYNNYPWEDIARFASWSISSSEFSSGSFVHDDWVLPLLTLQVHVQSWDDKSVPDAHVDLTNNQTGHTYSIQTETTDSNGNVTFTRIVNGTWYIDVWRTDSFNQVIHNNTASVVQTNLQKGTQVNIQLRLTRLNIQVQSSGFNVEGATVTVYFNNETVVAVGQTNSSGLITFEWIRGNMSSPWNYSYTVDVVKGGSSVNRTVVVADDRYTYVNTIDLPPPTYSQQYTEISSPFSFEQQTWYTNFTFWFEYYNRTSGAVPEKTNVTFGSSTTVGFEIYYNMSLVGYGTWTTSASSYLINSPANNHNWYFNATIDLQYWHLNASQNPYKIIIYAHTTGYNDPTNFTIYLTITEADTSLNSYDGTSFSEYYNIHSDHLFLLQDLTNTGNVTGLDTYNYTIRQGLLVLRSGYMISNSNGTYTVPGSAFHDLPVGNYILTVTMDRQNWASDEIQISVEISEVPMDVQITGHGSYDWSLSSDTITFTYHILLNDSSPDLAGVSVTVYWINHDTSEVYKSISLTLDPVGGVYTYHFTDDVVPIGDWVINITCSKDNFATAHDSFSYIAVDPAPTTLSAVSSSSVQVDWGEDAEFEISFVRDSDSVGLEGASWSHNWTAPITISDAGSGHYTITAKTLIEAGTYTLTIELSLANHVTRTIELTVQILVPLQISSDYNSAETPLETYWTHNFTIDVLLMDMSRVNTTVDGVTVTYHWYMQYVVDDSGSLTGTGSGHYSAELDATKALPLDTLYTVTITASKADCTSASITVFVRISAVPDEVVLPVNYFEQYYADVFYISFYWNNTLDNTPITYADTVTIEVIGVAANVTTCVGYGDGWYNVSIDTRALGMTTTEIGKVYFILFTMERAGFQTNVPVTAAVVVREASTKLVIDTISSVNWSESFTVTAHLWDTVHNILIDSAADITLIVPGSAYNVTVSNDGTGIFTWVIDSDAWFNGTTTYLFDFTYTLDNYVDGTNSTSVYIAPIPAVVTKDISQLEQIELIWGSNFSIRVNINQHYGSLANPIDGLAVTYTWSGTSVTGTLLGIGNGGYLTTVNSSEIVAGVYTITVTSVNKNYTFAPWTLDITVNPVTTVLESSDTELNGIHGGPSFTVYVSYKIATGMTFAGRILSGANVISDFGGGQVGTWVASEQAYRFIIDPSTVDPSQVPGTITITFTANLTNYAQATVEIVLHVSAKTVLTASSVQIEIDKSGILYLNYTDVTNGAPVPFSAVTSITIKTPLTEFTKEDVKVADDGRYYIILSPADIGAISSDPYTVTVSIQADGYEAQTGITTEVRIIETQYEILGVRVPQSQLQLFLLMLCIFVGIAALSVGVRRWRIPYQIKQINRALKDIEHNKHASVENIKSMGQVISELLAPGLAELDIPAPTIEMVHVEEYEEILGGETEDLLEGLDALDAIGAEETEPLEAVDFESEIAAEVESEMAEAPPEEEAAPEPETEVEEAPPEEESVPEEPSEDLESTSAEDELPADEDATELASDADLSEPSDDLSEGSDTEEPESDSLDTESVDESAPESDDTESELDELGESELEDLDDLTDESEGDETTDASDSVDDESSDESDTDDTE